MLENGVFPEFVEKNLCKLKIFRCSLVCGALLQVLQALGHVFAELPPLGDAQSALQTWNFQILQNLLWRMLLFVPDTLYYGYK